MLQASQIESHIEAPDNSRLVTLEVNNPSPAFSEPQATLSPEVSETPEPMEITTNSENSNSQIPKSDDQVYIYITCFFIVSAATFSYWKATVKVVRFLNIVFSQNTTSIFGT